MCSASLMFVKILRRFYTAFSKLQCNIRVASGTFNEFYLAFYSYPGGSWLAIACTLGTVVRRWGKKCLEST